MDIPSAVSSTKKYAQFFNFSLSPQEIHYWLIYPKRVSFRRLKPHLHQTENLSKQKSRHQSLVLSQAKTEHALKLVNILKFIPGIKMVAITGSVAALNAKPGDDIDLFIVTSRHCLWVIRPVALSLISFFFHRRHPREGHSQIDNAFCPNLWLDTSSLSLPKNKRNLYSAHEILQVKPILDREHTYGLFLSKNSWVQDYLANAYYSISGNHLHPTSKHALLTYLLAPINYLFFVIQYLYMYPKKTTEIVTPHLAFLHTTNYSKKINKFLTARKKPISTRYN